MELNEIEFNKKALELFNLSEALSDNWRINEKDSKVFLSKRTTISIAAQVSLEVDELSEDPASASDGCADELVSIEYHVLFHPSYQVPVLYFNAYSGNKNSHLSTCVSFLSLLDGSLIALDDIVRIFVDKYEQGSGQDLKNIITQAEHPILFKPFFQVHPCKVGEVLSNFKESQNFIITFLTLFGPSVRLYMSHEYEKFFTEKLN